MSTDDVPILVVDHADKDGHDGGANDNDAFALQALSKMPPAPITPAPAPAPATAVGSDKLKNAKQSQSAITRTLINWGGEG